MLPLQQAYEVKHSLIEYLRATFRFKDIGVHEAFYNFITHPEEGIFKGPYVSLKLPFVTAGESTGAATPLEIAPTFPPYHHQLQAFERLTTHGGHQPQSTLVTTGTSSGKTECFLYPILDYCHKHAGRKGIKVIILYPMNALATDQAKRLAEAIWNDHRLKGRITAGLFIGEGRDKKHFESQMGETHIIENRTAIVENPPDILLTNFKMLDYALMRNTFHKLWAYNFNDPTLLQYLVLDELHTYDGAQGSDVANLIRRLKLKLAIPNNHLCAVGTSATIGSGKDAVALLTDYAARVFGESFVPEAVIIEHRLGVDDFFTLPDEEMDAFIPRLTGLLASRMQENESYGGYIARQKSLWQIPDNTTPVQLGEELKKLLIVKDLLRVASQSIVHLDVLQQHLADANPAFRRLPQWDSVNRMSPREEVILSLLALISEAKTGEKKPFPFLYLQVQLWVRELSGVLREVGATPLFTWKDKVGERHEARALPAYFCRECGASGWLGIKDDNKNHFFSDPAQVYEYFFGNHKNTYFINTTDHPPVEEYQPENLIREHIHVADLALHQRPGDRTLEVIAVRKLRENNKSRHVCPECNTENTMGIIGTRVPTLSSITVSQALASDLDPRPDRERKILAFTNSVQDAAHQAGFIEARNYRFTFRASMQKVINQNDGPVSLTALYEQFLDYWKHQSGASGQHAAEAYYYRFLPADYQGKMDLRTDYRDAANRLTAAFKKEFDLRMQWEMLSEFGYNALIGRTLEKSETSAVCFDPDKVLTIYPTIKKWLDDNNLGMITESELLPFVSGLLHRVRVRGGVDHAHLTKFREKGLKLWDMNWMRDTRHFLNKLFHPRSRLPKMVSTQPHSRALLDTTHTRASNWFRSYFLKAFPMAPSYPDLLNEFYGRLFEVFVSVGIMNKKGSGEHENYAIVPDAMLVENRVTTRVCDSCGARLHVARNDSLSAGASCLDYSCTGRYSRTEEATPNYYQLVYNRNFSPRIYAAEHTGLLERKDREQKETDFKERPRFNSLNAIVATSTLEMGIDIGTLNAAINNSVPPLPSNFLQRVGRAGRASGAAFITNFAQSKAHDLFYYEAPHDMMAGEIATPGCFLEAKEILYRHFLAYCLDNWSAADPEHNGIPGRLLTLQLPRTDLSDASFFANRVIAFIKAHQQALLDRFVDFYRPDMGDAGALNSLRAYVQEEGLTLRFKEVFVRLKAEYHDILAHIDELSEAIRQLPADEERRELEAERKALRGLKRLLDKRSLLEHLTNVGLLPNYAFPETGVTLNAWVKAGKAKASEGLPTDQSFEIVRPASSAIRELAPDNHFYSQGYKMAVSGLNTFDWKDPGTLLKKRFCSNCDHIDDAISRPEPFCPKCGDASWASEKNTHVFVRMNGVKSANFRDRSRVDDSKDDRDSNPYRISRHLKFSAKSFQGAWGMQEIPFGIEYVKNVRIMEVNMGLSASVHANKVRINKQEDVPGHGFVSCRFCGKSTSAPNLPDQKFHYGYCKHKGHAYTGKSDEVFEEVFLFREIHTEALKVLLPVQEFESEATINMFRAGLELGMKQYYSGNPQHIHIIDYSEYNRKNGRFDRYLVLYDTIPGGTGYLEKLFNPAEFTRVIALAYESIKACGCQHKGRDGCYRCIFSYSNQYIREELSRAKAERLFGSIHEKSEAWETYTAGLGALTGNGQIEESELEDRFIRSLRLWCESRQDAGFVFRDDLEDGVVHYRMQLAAGAYVYSYVIRPQYVLGPAQGVPYNTRADFYISLAGVEKEGRPVDDPELLTAAKDIAVYLDGYTYHATAENFRFADDLKKRGAIAESERIRSWTLSWSDIERFDATESASDPRSREFKRDSLFVDPAFYRDAIEKYKAIPYWKKLKSGLISCRNSMERLLWLLEHPFEADLEKKVALMLSLRQRSFARPSADENLLGDWLQDPAARMDPDRQAAHRQEGIFYVFPELPETVDVAVVKLAIRLDDLRMANAVYPTDAPGDLDKEQWNSFWQVWNVVQMGE